MKSSETNICQSCGMPMKSLSDFGTHEDGSVNTEYCHYCYKKGEFTDDEISLEEKIAKNIAMAEKMGMSRKSASNLAQTTLPKLRRWNKARTKKKVN